MNFKISWVSTALLLAVGLLTSSCGGGGTSHIGPTVVSVTPKNGAVGVSRASLITATFNTPMSPASLNPSTMVATVASPAGPVVLPGTVTFTDRTATLQLATLMPSNTLVTVTITTGVKNLANQNLDKNYVWSFTTANTDVPPTVVSTVPVSGALGVPISTEVSATFSEAMDPSSITTTTFTLTPAGGQAVPAVVSYLNGKAVLDPTSALLPNTVYTATVTNGVKDIAGTPMVNNYVWLFTTAATDLAPTVVSTVPAAGAVGVSTSSNVSATFSEAMDPSSITTASFTLAAPGGVAVPATVSYTNGQAVLNPTSALLTNTLYTAKVTTGVRDVAGTPMAANYSWTFTTAAIDIAPTVVSTIPIAGAVGVSTSTNVSATFSEAMAPATINAANYTLTGPGGVAVPATVSYANGVALLNPTAVLSANTLYTAAISIAVTDVAGTHMVTRYTWTFTTAAVDVAPTVVSTIPAAFAVGVPIDTTVSATFSEAMNASTITTSTFTLAGPNGVALPATVTYSNGVATLNPTAPLASGTVYTGTVTTGVKDLAGTPMANTFKWTFTTDGPPIVISTFPADNQTQVGVNSTVTATFNKALDAATVNGATFTLKGPGGVSVPGTVTYSNKVASFNPTAALAGNTLYTATLTTGIKDAAGTPMANPFTWSFTTGQGLINLGTAGTYGVLGGSTVTNIGPTRIIGDLGVSPGAAITGFPPGTFTGTEHAGDAVAAKAKADLLAAYTDLTTRLGANALPGDISGLTIAPGLYKNSTSVLLAVGANVTFDAKGDPNAMFILQMGSTLTTGTNSTMTLIGGAQAKNIFWGVGSSATLGVNSSAVGNILAQASITANTGTVVLGRLLTNVAAISLDSNPITVPQ